MHAVPREGAGRGGPCWGASQAHHNPGQPCRGLTPVCRRSSQGLSESQAAPAMRCRLQIHTRGHALEPCPRAEEKAPASQVSSPSDKLRVEAGQDLFIPRKTLGLVWGRIGDREAVPRFQAPVPPHLPWGAPAVGEKDGAGGELSGFEQTEGARQLWVTGSGTRVAQRGLTLAARVAELGRKGLLIIF